jgi:hypothetical protein
VEKTVKKLVPYSVYLPMEYYNKIRKLAKERKASSTVRDAVMMTLDGNDAYRSGYNQGIRDAVKSVKKISDIKIIAIKGKYVDDLVLAAIENLEIT